MKKRTGEQAAESVRVVSAIIEGGRLKVVCESNSLSDLTEGKARKIAYEERLQHGMANAGIETVGGTYVPDTETKQAKKENRNVALWRCEFQITPMI